jgi:hypothetical protein
MRVNQPEFGNGKDFSALQQLVEFLESKVRRSRFEGRIL